MRAELDRSTGKKFGVNLDDDLCIQSISEGGLLAEWNTEHPRDAVRVGDVIVEANGLRDPDDIFDEMKEKKLLSIVLARVVVASPPAGGAIPSKGSAAVASSRSPPAGSPAASMEANSGLPRQPHVSHNHVQVPSSSRTGVSAASDADVGREAGRINQSTAAIVVSSTFLRPPTAPSLQQPDDCPYRYAVTGIHSRPIDNALLDSRETPLPPCKPLPPGGGIGVPFPEFKVDSLSSREEQAYRQLVEKHLEARHEEGSWQARKGLHEYRERGVCWLDALQEGATWAFITGASVPGWLGLTSCGAGCNKQVYRCRRGCGAPGYVYSRNSREDVQWMPSAVQPEEAIAMGPEMHAVECASPADDHLLPPHPHPTAPSPSDML